MLKRTSSALALLALTALLVTGCGKKSNPIAAFEPEVVNDQDAFQFQITDASNVNTTLTYSWTNTGSRATIDHSTVVARGSASVVILDASDVQVYSSGLKASANEESSAGDPGTWTVRVVFGDYSGTVNFRVEKL